MPRDFGGRQTPRSASGRSQPSEMRGAPAQPAAELPGVTSAGLGLARRDDDLRETVLLGCVYIDPPERTGSDGEVSWWVVDDLAGGEAERALDVLVPRWIAADWPSWQPRYLGRDISWRDWLALPRAS
jgi:hypothetical protein